MVRMMENFGCDDSVQAFPTELPTIRKKSRSSKSRRYFPVDEIVISMLQERKGRRGMKIPTTVLILVIWLCLWALLYHALDGHRLLCSTARVSSQMPGFCSAYRRRDLADHNRAKYTQDVIAEVMKAEGEALNNLLSQVRTDCPSPNVYNKSAEFMHDLKVSYADIYPNESFFSSRAKLEALTTKFTKEASTLSRKLSHSQMELLSLLGRMSQVMQYLQGYFIGRTNTLRGLERFLLGLGWGFNAHNEISGDDPDFYLKQGITIFIEYSVYEFQDYGKQIELLKRYFDTTKDATKDIRTWAVANEELTQADWNALLEWLDDRSRRMDIQRDCLRKIEAELQKAVSALSQLKVDLQQPNKNGQPLAEKHVVFIRAHMSVFANEAGRAFRHVKQCWDNRTVVEESSQGDQRRSQTV